LSCLHFSPYTISQLQSLSHIYKYNYMHANSKQHSYGNQLSVSTFFFISLARTELRVIALIEA